MVVVALLTVDRGPCILDTGEPGQVQPILAHPTVEALNKRVPRRLARLDEVQLDTEMFAPEVHCLGFELRPVVHTV